MKILLFIGAATLVNSAGGAERVFCNMANEFVRRGHDVLAVCNDPNSGLPFYPLDERIRFVNLNGTGKKKRYSFFLKAFREVSRHFRKTILDNFLYDPIEKIHFSALSSKINALIDEFQPDVVVPYFVDDYYAIAFQKPARVPTVLMHHGNSAVFFSTLNSFRKTDKVLRCLDIQVLLPSYARDIKKIYSGNIHFIPNTVLQIEDQDIADHTLSKNEYTITMISRIEPGKHQTLLVEAFARLADQYPQWKVIFYGSTVPKYEKVLREKISSFHLEKQVELAGTTNTPLEVLRQSDIFAFSSLSEGFPLALTEAMSAGLPCVGLKTTSAVNELIVDGNNGFLADNDPEDFANKLKRLMDDSELREHMGKAGHVMMKQYAPEVIWDQWENLLNKIVNKSLE